MRRINTYREFVADLANKAASNLDLKIKIKLAFQESELVNLIKDTTGIVVTGNIPGFSTSKTNYSYYVTTEDCLIMSLVKIPSDYQGTEKEYDLMQQMQDMMNEIEDTLRDTDSMCDTSIETDGNFNIEPEINIYGGFSGYSMRFKIKYND